MPTEAARAAGEGVEAVEAAPMTFDLNRTTTSPGTNSEPSSREEDAAAAAPALPDCPTRRR